MNKVKLFSLATTSAAIGLLLGGNVLAQSSQYATTTAATSTASTATTTAEAAATTTAAATSTVGAATTTQAVSAQVSILQQKVKDLAAAIQKNISQQTPTPVQGRALTQAQLDVISAKVGKIAAMTAEIQRQVQIFVAMREINNKIAVIKSQVAGTSTVKIGTNGVPELMASSTAATGKDAQIAKIKQQIGELTQEYRAQKKLEEQNQTMSSSASDSSECIGDSCGVAQSGNNEQTSIEVVSNSSNETKTETENKGFWSSVGDFFRKIFTF